MRFPRSRLQALVLAFVCVLAPMTRAQAVQPERHLSNLAAVSYTRSQGLPQSGITALAATDDGFLWVGTQAGLARFDGDSFAVMETSNTPAMEDQFITSLLPASSGELWIGTRSGLLVRGRDGSVRRLDESDGLPNEYVRSLLEDSQGRVWVGTYGGGLSLWRADGPRNFIEPEGLDNGFVRALADDPSGPWIGTSKGLYKMVDGVIEAVGSDEDIGGAFIRSLVIDSRGVLWIGTQGSGLWSLADGVLAPQSMWAELEDSATVWAVREDHHGALLVAGDGFGLHRVFETGVEKLRAADGLSSDVVLTLMEDREGSLWVGTRAGLTQLKETAISTLTTRDGLADDFVRTVYQDPRGGVWVGSDDGLDHWSGDDVEISRHRRWLESSQVRSVVETSDGVMWVGTRVGLFRRRGNDFEAVDLPGLTGTVINALAEDSGGCLWIGTGDGGVSRSCNGEVTAFSERLSTQVVRVIQEDHDGTMWCGTENGLVGLQGDDSRVLTTADGLPGDFVYAIHVDPAGVLWLGTNGGLARVVDGRARAIGRGEGLPVDLVFQILEDEVGYLWLSTPQGLVRVARDRLNRRADGADVALDHLGFDESDGMASSECNGGSQPAAWAFSDGRLWFATFGGVAVVDPAAVTRRLPTPRPVVDRLTVDGAVVGHAVTSKLAPGTREVEIVFTAPSLFAPHKVRFRYRLDGYHDRWISAGPRRNAHFGALGPGRYRFRVQAAGEDGLWSEREATVRFEILPRFWQTRWFIGLAVIAVLLSGRALVRWRMARAARRERELEAVVEQRTGELEEANEQLKRLAAIDFLTQVANHRRFRQALDEEWRRHMRNEAPLSLILVDVDFFKVYNDRYGHQQGDDVLRAVAQTLAAVASRSGDLVARYGGEEFAVILAGTDRDGAIQVAETLRAAVQALDYEHGAAAAGVVTVSAGVATVVPRAGLRPEDLVAGADSALYAAKRGGRNRICVEGAG